jgi:hypothetical protein
MGPEGGILCPFGRDLLTTTVYAHQRDPASNGTLLLSLVNQCMPINTTLTVCRCSCMHDWGSLSRGDRASSSDIAEYQG